MSDRVIQTYGDAAFGHHAQLSDRVIQTYGDAAFGHHAQPRGNGEAGKQP
jgi:hypothetical protein